MTEAPRASIGFDPEKAVQQCKNRHCVAMTTVLLKSGDGEVAACLAERQISSADNYQEAYDTYQSLRIMIARCPYGSAILGHYNVST